MKPVCSYVIIEDEPLQAEHLQNLLKKRLDLLFVGHFDHAKMAYDYLTDAASVKPDLIFLDIQMSDISGFGLLDLLNRLPLRHRIIITTAHPEEAVRGYEYDVTGFILKPINYDKLNAAIEKALNELNTNIEPRVIKNEFIDITVDRDINRINYADLIYIEGADIYAIFHTNTLTYKVRDALRNIISTLNTDRFIRVHDSFIVNLDYYAGHAKNMTYMNLKKSNGLNIHQLPIGKKYRDEVRDRLKNL